jgi:hypothetical protein
MTMKHELPESLGSGLRSELEMLLDGGQAHATFAAAVADFPSQLRGVVPEDLPYSAWQIVEHMRIAQRDILDFSRNSDGLYVSRKWPDSYWPDSPEPPNGHAWQSAIHEIGDDRKAFEALLTDASDADLTMPFTWGDGQNLLHEAFLVAAHMSYHTGELIVVRRLLGAWKK